MSASTITPDLKGRDDVKNGTKPLIALLALGLASCTTTNGEQPGILQSMQQVVGAASMAVGIRAGDTSLATKSLQRPGGNQVQRASAERADAASRLPLVLRLHADEKPALLPDVPGEPAEREQALLDGTR
jgi:hypothetical protein